MACYETTTLRRWPDRHAGQSSQSPRSRTWVEPRGGLLEDESVSPLARHVAVDVLVDPSLVRTGVAAPPAGIGIERTALVDVGRPVVLVLGDLARIVALHRVAVVGPYGEGEPSE